MKGWLEKKLKCDGLGCDKIVEFKECDKWGHIGFNNAPHYDLCADCFNKINTVLRNTLGLELKPGVPHGR